MAAGLIRAWSISWEFPKIRAPYFGDLIILLFRVLYWGPLFSETPIWVRESMPSHRGS